MGFWDFIFGWKVINDQDKEDLTEEDELRSEERRVGKECYS